MIPILRLVHVVFGVFWVGSVLFVTFVVMPSLRGAGPSGMAVMKDLGRRMPPIMIGSALLTVGAGIGLMFTLHGGPGLWMQSGTGRTFATGGALAILALLFGMAVNAPASARMGAIGETIAKRGGPPTPDEAMKLQQLQARLAMASIVVVILLLLATGAMAVARYMP